VNRSSTGEVLAAVVLLLAAESQGEGAETVADAARSSRVTGGGAQMASRQESRQVGDGSARRLMKKAAWC
jgi:hypothetical protein